MHEAIKVHRCQQEGLASASAGRRLLKVLVQAYRKHEDTLSGTPSQRGNFQCCACTFVRACVYGRRIFVSM